VPVNIFWANNLVDEHGIPLKHLLPVDTTIHWAFKGVANWEQYGVPVVTHIHGGHTESASDGIPESWYTPYFTQKGMQFKKGDIEPFHYNNDQEAATIWYHDHALGITRLNVYTGLAGFYLITDQNEINLKAGNQLPASPYDLGLAIQDRMFTNDGQLFYPSKPTEESGPDPSIIPEFFGDFILVNGKSWPVLEVEPRQYRFRILNGSDSRFYNLFLSNGDNFMQIGSDDGLLPAPVSLNKMLIGPGERRDVVIDFSNPALWGKTILVQNNAKTPYPKGRPVNPQTTGRIMAFKVTKPLNTNYPLTILPSILRAPIARLSTTLEPRKLILFEAEDEYDRLKPMLGTIQTCVQEWHDPITENPMQNDTEIWEIYNETMDAHPIHLHMVHMQLVSRQKFHADVDPVNGKPSNIRLLGNPQPPAPEEAGWKDTYVMYPGEVTKIIATFDLEGLYVWHCHILSHEDHDMMRPFYVTKKASQLFVKTDMATATGLFEKQVDLRTIPNPFSNQLKIQFNLLKPSDVYISIMDSKGNVVQKVFEGKSNAGIQQFTIDGSRWSNGTYFCEVVINNQRLMRKLILQK